MSTYSVAPRYLSLALASRRVIDTLMEARREGQVREPQLREALIAVVESVRNAGKGEKFFASASGSIFEHYEQKIILREVLKDTRPADIQESLSRLLKDPADDEKLQDDLQTTVDFFFALETRALHRFEQGMSADE